MKDGWQIEFSTPPVWVNRRGYQTVFSLPMGVTPEMIADKRDVLARNLVRAPLEVWPAAAEHAGYVDLWVADPGSTNASRRRTRCFPTAKRTSSRAARSGVPARRCHRHPLLIMGAATFLIGALPTYQAIGVAAPILLVVLWTVRRTKVESVVRWSRELQPHLHQGFLLSDGRADSSRSDQALVSGGVPVVPPG